jgi:Dolichyl-phosphate-mannose-protein mannosyltransferase
MNRPASESTWTRPRTVLLLLALWLMATMGLRPLLLPDEGRYANVARDMLLGASSDGLVPLLNGLPFFHKPPLLYWLDMLAMGVVGVNQFSARFAPFVGAWVMGAALFMAVRRWHGAVAARATLLVLATCPFFFIGGQYANLDMLVGGLITATVLAFARAVDYGARSLRWMLLAWVFAAASVLAKGLIGFVLPALVIAPWLLAQRRWRDLLWLLHPLGLLLFVALALPWFALMQMRYPGFFDYFIMEQHFRRFAQASFNNVHPAWFYVAVLPLLTLPWSGWLPASLMKLRSGWNAHSASDRSRCGLWAWWLVAVIGFFSLPSSKLVGYALPALAPWCAVLGVAVAASLSASKTAWKWTLAAAVFVCLGLVSLLSSPAAMTALKIKPPTSSKAAAAVLATQIKPDDRVVFVDEMFYDLPFYAGLKQPPVVASDWADPKVPLRDNWRKELFDAARFDPARGRELLWPLDQLNELTCGEAAVWFVLKDTSMPQMAQVTSAVGVLTPSDVRLMRAPGRACSAEAPSPSEGEGWDGGKRVEYRPSRVGAFTPTPTLPQRPERAPSLPMGEGAKSRTP